MTLAELFAEICLKYNVTPARLRGNGRTRPVPDARAEFSWRGHNLGYSYPALGRFLGMDHTTILKAARRHEAKARVDAGWKAPGTVSGGEW